MNLKMEHFAKVKIQMVLFCACCKGMDWADYRNRHIIGELQISEKNIFWMEMEEAAYRMAFERKTRVWKCWNLLVT